MRQLPKPICLNLLTGTIHVKEGSYFDCYFIVEHVNDVEYIKKHALELMIAGGRVFHFWGKYSNLWDIAFDEVDIARTNDEEDWAETCSWPDTDSFVDAIALDLSCRSFVPHYVYLIYDDEDARDKILNLLRLYSLD